MRRERIFVLLLCGLLSVHVLRGQQLASDEFTRNSRPFVPQSGAAIRSQANLVEVRVVVRDAKGRAVAGLGQADFQLSDEGVPQKISAFSVETAAPRDSAPATPSATAPSGNAPPSRVAPPPQRFIALFFDDLNLKVGDLAPARDAARRYVKSGLAPGDLLAVITSSSSGTLEFTNDTRKILNTLDKLSPHYKSPGDAADMCPRISPLQALMIAERNDRQALELGIAQGIALGCLEFVRRPVQESMVESRAREVLRIAEGNSKESLAILQSVIEFLARTPRRRMLLFTSSGFFAATTTLRQRQDDLLNLALRSGIIINSLDAKGLVGGSIGGDPSEGSPVSISARPDLIIYAEQIRTEQLQLFNEPLSMLAAGTGGRFFHNNNDLARGIRELAAPPDVAYYLSFAPADLKPDGSYHNIKVKLAAPGDYSLDARRGYFAPVAPRPGQLTVSDRFEAAVLATGDDVTTVPIQLATRVENSTGADRQLNVTLHVDVRNLRFERRGERSIQRLRFAAALFTPDGQFVTGHESIIDLALKDSSHKSLSAQGLDEQLTLRAPAGSYRLRAVVQELVQNRISTLTRPITFE